MNLVADRHLVHEATQIPLHLRHACLEGVAPALEIDDLTLRRGPCRPAGAARQARRRRGRAARGGSPGAEAGPAPRLRNSAINASFHWPKKFPVNLSALASGLSALTGATDLLPSAEQGCWSCRAPCRRPGWPFAGPPWSAGRSAPRPLQLPGQALRRGVARGAWPGWWSPWWRVLRFRPRSALHGHDLRRGLRLRRRGVVAEAPDQHAEPDRQQQHADARHKRGA